MRTSKYNEHLLFCDNLKMDTIDPEIKFDFVYQNLEKQAKAVKAYKLILSKREIMLKL